jgi:hypothetical protein
MNIPIRVYNTVLYLDLLYSFPTSDEILSAPFSSVALDAILSTFDRHEPFDVRGTVS